MVSGLSIDEGRVQHHGSVCLIAYRPHRSGGKPHAKNVSSFRLGQLRPQAAERSGAGAAASPFREYSGSNLTLHLELPCKFNDLQNMMASNLTLHPDYALRKQ